MICLDRYDWINLFNTLYPNFFNTPLIQSLPEGALWEEMALPLSSFSPGELEIPIPRDITFGFYEGDIPPLQEEIRRVDAFWPDLFTEGQRIYCAFEKERMVSFCLLEDMGTFKGLRIAGPGCVGTLPEYRRRGIGLRMVQNATSILMEEGYDISYIHYTGVGLWYSRLGYRTVLRWNRHGFAEPTS